MVFKLVGELSKIFGKDANDRRFQIWLWHFLVIYKGHQYLFGKSPYDVEALGDVFVNNPEIKSEALYLKDQNLLPVEYLSWIKNNPRQNRWLANKLCEAGLLGLDFYSMHASLTDFEKIVLAIDCASSSGQQKIVAVRQLQNEWSGLLNDDVIYDWFQKKDEIARCKFLWDWLRGHGYFLINTPAEFKNFQDVVIYFDGSFLPKSDKILQIEKIKKAWSQSQYRKSQGGKKQCNLMLAENVILLLDKLSMKYGFSKAEIVELLIKEESEKGVYISGRLAQRKQVLS